MATESASPPSTTPPAAAPPQRSKHPYVGILGVFLGASVATVNARLLSVGLADLRGAIGFGFDEASWIPTVLDMAMMFSGVFCVFLNSAVGPSPHSAAGRRAVHDRVHSASVFAEPLGNVWPAGDLAGLTSGTFYSLTLDIRSDCALPKRLVIFGIAAYAGDIVFDEQHRISVAGLVRRASLLALDLLECRGLHAADDDLRLFRHPPSQRARRARGQAGVGSRTSAWVWPCWSGPSIRANGWTG